ncbi:Cell division protein FtsN [Mannheimia haemolytica]|uniref:Cell division protein FtsN n=1 Tax=Mannheimia haemolytica TaxID=75985 RepID=A0A3S4XD02_MANHA|nr:cell division protein FtsN [Mannheimia haemolytica]VEI76202.1 Cell division protein FtsN [Mannheimia haemolytica]
MPQRDYVARSNEKKSKKNQKESNVKKILMLIIGLILLCGIGLWFLKSSAPTPIVPTTTQPSNPQAKSELPSRPEETWSYIRDLETRTVITDNSQTSQERLAQLTAEQKQQIEERRKQEEARLVAEQAQQDVSATESAPKTVEVTPLTDEELAAKKAQEQALAQKQAEEKRRQAELKKQQEAKKAEQAKLAEEKAKKEQPAKIVASAATPADKAANQAGKFGLQCGAFKNKAQAENMQARLAMAGFNARIASSADWNRVFVGPIGDRAATSRAQSNARSVAECVIVAM